MFPFQTIDLEGAARCWGVCGPLPCTVMFNFVLSDETVLCVEVMFWHKLWSVSSGATHYVPLALEVMVGIWTLMMSSGKGLWHHI